MPTADVARAFGLGTPTRDLTFVARGAMGEVFRLDTERGPFAVKRLFWGPAGDEDANAAFQFAAADAGVPLPRPVLATNGDVLSNLADGWWRVYEWVEGEPLVTADPVAMARAIGRLHAIKYDAGSVLDPWYAEALGAERINSAVDAAIAHGFAFEPRRDALLAFDEIVAVAPAAELIGCHLDTDVKNVLVHATGLVLIDWDNAGPGIAASEFASVLGQWSGDDPAVVRSMVRAYRDEGCVFAPCDVTVFAQGLSAFVHYVVMCCGHLDAGVAPEELAHERPMLEHLAATNLSVARFERILELVPA